MPGGNKNIRPEDGKQFSSDYQPQEKWTEARALQIAADLKAWHRSDPTHIFWEEFLMLENDYPEKLISYLCKKFSSFSTLIEDAKKMQEIKLKKYGTADALNAAMTKFVLINEHNWKDKQETENIIKFAEPVTGMQIIRDE
jgi:hypothetical protein